jgi:hypothetical protein
MIHAVLVGLVERRLAVLKGSEVIHTSGLQERRNFAARDNGKGQFTRMDKIEKG